MGRAKGMGISDGQHGFASGVALVLALVLLTACNDGNDLLPITEKDWRAPVALQKAIDTNPAEDVVEVFLEAVEKDVEIRPGKVTPMWTYNGVFPGPLIEAKVGDTLVVHFTNYLPEETTVHWHGVELPANMDGSSISQLPVSANGGTFTYRFKLLRAATYWYHPHIRGHRQVESGLYGALVVRDPVKDQQLGLPEQELVLILDDILLDAEAAIMPPYPDDPITYANTQLNGREGNVFLINGRSAPITLEVPSGISLRIRLINAANSRFFRLSLPKQEVFRIGGDGGLLAKALPVPPIDILTSAPPQKPKGVSARHATPGAVYFSNPDPNLGVLLVPGERAELVTTLRGRPRGSAILEWHDFPRGKHFAFRDDSNQILIGHDTGTDGASPSFELLKFLFTDESVPQDKGFDEQQALNEATPITVTDNTPRLPVTFGHGLPDENGNIRFFATMREGRGIPFDELSAADALHASVGETYIWEVTNLTEGDHPFHPHGFTFQWLETEYIDLDSAEPSRLVKADRTEEKDTIRIPGRPGLIGRSRTVVRLAVRFGDEGREGLISAGGKQPSASESGGWLVHCHILEHANRGMTTFLNLAP